MLLSTAYLPPIWYIEKLVSVADAVIESQENFIKQTIRNRCHILSPNGIQTLIIPVSHANRNNSPVKDIRIANENNWQRQHWRSLCAAYQRSAFFEFYQDDLYPFYEKQYDFLFEFNMELLHFLMLQLKLKTTIGTSVSYCPPSKEIDNDFRFSCNTGNPQVFATAVSYPQVFSYKEGFTPGLSIVDLLFNMGPAAVNIMKS